MASATPPSCFVNRLLEDENTLSGFPVVDPPRIGPSPTGEPDRFCSRGNHHHHQDEGAEEQQQHQRRNHDGGLLFRPAVVVAVAAAVEREEKGLSDSAADDGGALVPLSQILSANDLGNIGPGSGDSGGRVRPATAGSSMTTFGNGPKPCRSPSCINLPPSNRCGGGDDDSNNNGSGDGCGAGDGYHSPSSNGPATPSKGGGGGGGGGEFRGMRPLSPVSPFHLFAGTQLSPIANNRLAGGGGSGAGGSGKSLQFPRNMEEEEEDEDRDPGDGAERNGRDGNGGGGGGGGAHPGGRSGGCRGCAGRLAVSAGTGADGPGAGEGGEVGGREGQERRDRHGSDGGDAGHGRAIDRGDGACGGGQRRRRRASSVSEAATAAAGPRGGCAGLEDGRWAAISNASSGGGGGGDGGGGADGCSSGGEYHHALFGARRQRSPSPMLLSTSLLDPAALPCDAMSLYGRSDPLVSSRGRCDRAGGGEGDGGMTELPASERQPESQRLDLCDPAWSLGSILPIPNEATTSEDDDAAPTRRRLVSMHSINPAAQTVGIAAAATASNAAAGASARRTQHSHVEAEPFHPSSGRRASSSSVTPSGGGKSSRPRKNSSKKKSPSGGGVRRGRSDDRADAEAAGPRPPTCPNASPSSAHFGAPSPAAAAAGATFPTAAHGRAAAGGASDREAAAVAAAAPETPKNTRSHSVRGSAVRLTSKMEVDSGDSAPGRIGDDSGGGGGDKKAATATPSRGRSTGDVKGRGNYAGGAAAAKRWETAAASSAAASTPLSGPDAAAYDRGRRTRDAVGGEDDGGGGGPLAAVAATPKPAGSKKKTKTNKLGSKSSPLLLTSFSLSPALTLSRPPSSSRRNDGARRAARRATPGPTRAPPGGDGGGDSGVRSNTSDAFDRNHAYGDDGDLDEAVAAPARNGLSGAGSASSDVSGQGGRRPRPAGKALTGEMFGSPSEGSGGGGGSGSGSRGRGERAGGSRVGAHAKNSSSKHGGGVPVADGRASPPGPAIMAETEQNPCTCKKCKCLKLYCDCFARSRFCGPACLCKECHNRAGEEALQEARRSTLDRNPDAFTRALNLVKNPTSVQDGAGCGCTKSQCLKKYCVCFQRSVRCGSACKCEGCMNTVGNRGPSNAADGSTPQQASKLASASMNRETDASTEVLSTPSWRGSAKAGEGRGHPDGKGYESADNRTGERPPPPRGDAHSPPPRAAQPYAYFSAFLPQHQAKPQQQQRQQQQQQQQQQHAPMCYPEVPLSSLLLSPVASASPNACASAGGAGAMGNAFASLPFGSSLWPPVHDTLAENMDAASATLEEGLMRVGIRAPTAVESGAVEPPVAAVAAAVAAGAQGIEWKMGKAVGAGRKRGWIGAAGLQRTVLPKRREAVVLTSPVGGGGAAAANGSPVSP